MEPPAPDPQTVIPESLSPRLVTVGVQYDAPTDPLNALTHPLDEPLPRVTHLRCMNANGSTGGLQMDLPASNAYDSHDQTLLAHPLKSGRTRQPSMDDSTTTTEEYDMADGHGLGKAASDSVSDTDSLDSNPSVLTPARDSSLGHRKLTTADKMAAADQLERVSVDLADLSLTDANGAVEDLPRGVSEASDSGFSRSGCSDTPEKDSESGASDKSATGQVFAPMQAMFTHSNNNAATPRDEGIDLAVELNGSAEPPPTPSDTMTTNSTTADVGASGFPSEQRRGSNGSLNESISSTQSSGGHSLDNSTFGANKLTIGTKASTHRGQPTAGKNNTDIAKARRGRSKYSHITSRINSGRMMPAAGKERSPNQSETTIAELEEMPAAPTKKRVHFENCGNSKDGVDRVEDEEEFVIHPGPGYDDAGNGGESAHRIVSFQEPRSLVKQYIKGRPHASRPRIIRQTTVEVAELAKKPQRAIPLPQASAIGGAPNIPVKQTIASKKRKEKLVQESQAQMEKLQAESQYMTPLQRKEAEVKELKRQLHEAYYIIEQREMELDVFHHEKEREIRDAVDEKDDMLRELEENTEILQDELDAAKADNNELMEHVAQLEQRIQEMKMEADKKELRHQGLYLKMYHKGRDSALFERQDELEKIATDDPDSVSKEELLQKLATVQHELEHWQRVKLTEHYDEASKPETEADAMLNFLKDSMYHYVTETKLQDVEQHLNAMVRIFHFTDVQMKSINKALEERKRKGKL